MPNAAIDLQAQSPRKLHEIESEITELAAHIHAATYRLLELVREFDEREGWGGPGLKSCAHWLNWKCGIGLGAAREKVRVAHALTDLREISDAFRRGMVSFSKVRAMTRVATPENEEYLMMIARHGTASHVEHLVREPLNKSARSAFQSEKPQIVRAVASDSSRRYGQVTSRARCGFSGACHDKRLSGRAFAGHPAPLVMTIELAYLE